MPNFKAGGGNALLRRIKRRGKHTAVLERKTGDEKDDGDDADGEPYV